MYGTGLHLRYYICIWKIFIHSGKGMILFFSLVMAGQWTIIKFKDDGIIALKKNWIYDAMRGTTRRRVTSAWQNTTTTSISAPRFCWLLVRTIKVYKLNSWIFYKLTQRLYLCYLICPITFSSKEFALHNKLAC